MGGDVGRITSLPGSQFYDRTVVSGDENCVFFHKRYPSLHHRQQCSSAENRRKCRSVELAASPIGISTHYGPCSHNPDSHNPDSLNDAGGGSATQRCCRSPHTSSRNDRPESSRRGSRRSWSVSEEFSVRSSLPIHVILKG